MCEVTICKGGSLWRPPNGDPPDAFLILSVAMATKWRPNGDLLMTWRILYRHGAHVATSHVQVAKMPCFFPFVRHFSHKSSTSSQLLLEPDKTWNTQFNNIKHGEMPENQAKRIGNEGQNHTNFGLIKYPQTNLLLVLEQTITSKPPKTCIEIFQRLSLSYDQCAKPKWRD